jgi:hypothetical protein
MLLDKAFFGFAAGEQCLGASLAGMRIPLTESRFFRAAQRLRYASAIRLRPSADMTRLFGAAFAEGDERPCRWSKAEFAIKVRTCFRRAISVSRAPTISWVFTPSA